jgi:hypothetical protein
MPRLKNETSILIADLKSRIDRMVEIAMREGHDRALGEIRALVGGGLTPVKRGPGRPPKSSYGTMAAPAKAKPRKKRRNPWAHMTAEQKADRVRKMLAGRGLKPKSDR